MKEEFTTRPRYGTWYAQKFRRSTSDYVRETNGSSSGRESTSPELPVTPRAVTSAGPVPRSSAAATHLLQERHPQLSGAVAVPDRQPLVVVVGLAGLDCREVVVHDDHLRGSAFQAGGKGGWAVRAASIGGADGKDSGTGGKDRWAVRAARMGDREVRMGGFAYIASV